MYCDKHEGLADGARCGRLAGHEPPCETTLREPGSPEFFAEARDITPESLELDVTLPTEPAPVAQLWLCQWAGGDAVMLIATGEDDAFGTAWRAAADNAIDTGSVRQLHVVGPLGQAARIATDLIRITPLGNGK